MDVRVDITATLIPFPLTMWGHASLSLRTADLFINSGYERGL